MSIREAAAQALAQQTEANRLAREAKHAEQKRRATQACRQWFASQLGVSGSDLEVTGQTNGYNAMVADFVLEGLHGVWASNGRYLMSGSYGEALEPMAQFKWYTQYAGNTKFGIHSSKIFKDLPSLAVALAEVDKALEAKNPKLIWENPRGR